MWWRLPRAAWTARKGAQNRAAFRELVEAGPAPGIIAYRDGRAVGWCAIAPRETYVVLERSRTLKRLDDRPVWSVTCFFVERAERRKGVSVELLKAAVRFVKGLGGECVEGYPVEPGSKEMPAAFAWTGTAAAFRKAGFTEVARTAATRPVMRFGLSGASEYSID